MFSKIINSFKGCKLEKGGRSMPQLIPLQLDEIISGEASNFRNTLNSNFEKISAYFEEIGTGGNGIIVSRTQPAAGEQETNDFWYKIL